MISEKAKKEILKVMEHYPTTRSAVMPALMIVQRERGSLVEEDMTEIANVLDVQPVVVNEISRFYTMYSVGRTLGKYHIQICRNLSCSLLDAERIIAHVEGALGIKVGETTGDRRFTLSTAECLGSCGTAPMMQINDDYYEDLTEQKVNEILKKLD